MLHTAPAIADGGGGGGGIFASESGGYGGFRSAGGVGGGTGTSRLQSSPVPLPFPRGSLNATPEDRQRAVAHLLARAGSFSEKASFEPANELSRSSDEGTDGSPNSTPKSHPMEVSSAPPPMDFVKETVTPARSYTSGLAGIHRPSLAASFVQTPNRYQIDTPAAAEYSESGQRKAKLYKCSVFLPPDGECVQMQVKQNTTAAQLVHQVMSEYLKKNQQPHPAMLGQPTTYRLYLAEDDGELDDSFPPLDPGCVVSSTAADCFALQRRIAPSTTTSNGSVRSVSCAAPSSIRPRIGSMGVSDEHSQSRVDDFDDPTASASDAPYRQQNATAKARRTSSDADDYIEEDAAGRNRGSSAAGSTAPPARTRSFTPFSWRACLSCSCLKVSQEEAEHIEEKRRPSRG